MIISLVQEKGGSGKTTIAINLAAAIKQKGHSVLLVDADPQASARDWHTNNDGSILEVIGLDRPTIDKDIQIFANDYDFILIDGAPRLSIVSTKIIILSDLVLIPVKPSPYDVWAARSIVDLVKQRQEITGGFPHAAFVVSCQIVNTIIGRDVREALAAYGLPVLSQATFNRVAYAQTAAHGKTVLTSADNMARNEITQLAEEILKFKEVIKNGND